MDAIHKLHLEAELIYWNVLYVNVGLRRMAWPRNGYSMIYTDCNAGLSIFNNPGRKTKQMVYIKTSIKRYCHDLTARILFDCNCTV